MSQLEKQFKHEFSNEFDDLMSEELDLESEHLYKTIKTGTPIDTGKARRSWKLIKSEKMHKIQSTIHYMERLWYGWSKQQPKGMDHLLYKTRK